MWWLLANLVTVGCPRMSRNDIKVVIPSMMPEHWEAAEAYFCGFIFPGNETRDSIYNIIFILLHKTNDIVIINLGNSL